MKKVSTTFLFAVLFTFILNAMAWGQILVEDFSYTPATSLNGQGGWTAHSGVGTNPPQITSGGLTYTGYASSGIGNAVSFTTNGEDNNRPYRTFPNGITSGSLYYSLMVKIDSATSTGDYFFHLNKSATIFTARIFARRASNGNIRFGIGKASAIGGINFSDSIYVPGTTHLLVVKHTVIAGATNDTVALWVDPAIGVPEGAPTVFESIADRAAADVDSLYGFALRQGTAANAPMGTIDGVRVDSIWAFGPTGGPVVRTIPGDYASLAAAIADLDTQGVAAGGVTFNVAAGYTETAPDSGFKITATGTLSDPIVFQKSGLGADPTFTASPTLAAGALNDAIIKIIGGDYITIRGFALQENPANTITAAGTNNMTEFGVGVFYATTTNGAQNNTIQNCTITLNRTYQNTFGIYSNVRHSAASVLAAADITDPAGANSNLTITANTISNVNIGIVAVGSLVGANMDTGLDIGAGGALAGSLGSTGNSISNYGTTGTFSAYVSVGASVNGIYLNNQQNFKVSYNSITSSTGGVTVAGTIRGIYVQTTGTLPASGAFTRTINNNNISVQGGFASNVLQGVTTEGGNLTTSQTISNNNFHDFGHTVSGTGAITFIAAANAVQNSTISNNTFTNMTVNTIGAVTFINKNVTHPASAVLVVNNNSIITGFSKTGAGGTVRFYDSFNTSPVTVIETNFGNNFSNVTLTGATTLDGWRSADGPTGAPFGPAKTITGNTFASITGGTSAITSIMTVGYSNTGAANNVSGNTISNITGGGAITIITSPTASQNFYSNTIHTVSSTGASVVNGISLTGGVVQNVYKNKIYNVTSNNAAGTVNGILVSTIPTTVNIYNNLIGDLKAPLTSNTDAIRGISMTGTTASTTLNVSYNTVNLNATSSGANFGTSGIFHAYSATATSAMLNLRDNIVVNTSIPAGTGLTVALRRSAATDLNNYGSVSNNNLFYAGTPGATNLIFFDGTNSDQTLAAFQTRVGPRDSASVTENPPFISTTGSDSTFLHISPSIATQIDSGGTPVAGIADDFDGNSRDASTPDIGADEFASGGPPPPPPAISAIVRSTRAPFQGDSVVVTCTIVDAAGVSASNLLYTIDGGSPVSVPLPRVSGTANNGSYQGVIPGSANQNGNRIEYRIFASNGGSDSTSPILIANSYFAGISPMSITGVRAMDSLNAIRYKGIYARVAGTINGPNFQSSNLSQYFQDGLGGLNLFKVGGLAGVRNLGDSITVLGKLDQFRGVTEIVPDTLAVDIQTVATGRPVPIIDLTVTQYNADPETYESRVVRFAALNRKYPGVPPWPPALTQAAIVMYQTNPTDTVTMFINAGTNIPGSTEPTYPVTVASIAIQFAASGAATQGGYEVLPRYLTDFTYGPGLFGNYTVGVAGNYTTLSAAIHALDSAGVAGPVTFSLLDASYADTALIILPYAGQGPAKMVTFKPANGVTARILIAGGSAATNTVGIRMDSVSGIVWDGSNSGGSDRSLTIESDTNTTTGRTPILIRKGSRNVTLKNLIVKGNRHSAGGIPSVIVIDNTGFASSGGQHNMTVNNCQVLRGNNGIFANAASGAVRDSNHTFTNNLVGGGSSASLFDHLAAAGITMTGNHNVMVADNDINGIKVAGTPVGIRVNGGNTATTVTRNRIHNMVTVSGAFRPLCILVGNIIATGPGVRTRAVISNNMVYDIHNFGIGVSGRALSGYIYNPTGGASSPNGAGSTIEWYFNSMNVEYAAGEGGPSTNTAFYFDGNFAGTTNQSDSVIHVNNIGSIKRADTLSTRQFLILQETVPGNAVWLSDNNDYFNNVGPSSAAFAQIPSPFPSGGAVTVPDLAAFRDSTRLDSSSVFGDPQFVSAADAHIRTDVPTPVESAGRPIAGITTDFDGTTRNASTPDIGADEGTFMPASFHDIGVASLGAGAAPNVSARSPLTTEFIRGYAGKPGREKGDAGMGQQRSNGTEVLATSELSTFSLTPLDANFMQYAEGVPDEREQIAVNDFSMAYLLASARSTTPDRASQQPARTPAPAFATRDNAGGGSVVLSRSAGDATMFRTGVPLNFLARVQNFGTFDEPSYQIAWTIDGILQTPVNSSAPLEIGDVDTLQLSWAAPTVGSHTARAWTVLGPDGNASNDTSAPYLFQVQPAANILFEEIFPDTTVPAGWLVVNNDGSPAANSSWRFSQQINFASGDTIRPQAGASFWFASYTGANAGGLIDEWLITPHILAADFDSVYFYCGAIGGSFPDSIRVRVSTTGNTVPSFTNQIAYFKVPGPIGSWNKFGFDLSPFDGQDIYIAINYYIVDGGPSGNNSDNVWVDHMIVTGTALPPPPPLGWTPQVSGISTYLYSVKAVNQNVAWAAGAGGKVLRTTNHGSTWDSVGGGAIGVADIYNIEAIDANTAFVTTSPGATFIYKTTNGGTTWTQVFTLAGGFINAMHMVDATTGYAEGDPVGGTWTILKTTDGGSSWARMATEPAAVGGEFGTQNGLSMVGSTHIWFNSNTGGRIYRSTNAGVTWSSGVAPFAATSNVWFNDTQYGLATGSTASGVARSTDGGATWTSVTVAGTGFLIACGGSGATDFWYARGTTVYRSTNRGATFSSSYVGTGSFVGLSFVTYGPSSTSGWAVTSTGGIAGFYGAITGVENDGQGEIPTSFALMQNYPNPFNPSTTIRFSVPTQSTITLKIYNILGQTVATVVDEMKQTGNYSFQWNGRNDFGAQVASGVYFCRLEARPIDGSNPFASMKKMLFVK